MRSSRPAPRPRSPTSRPTSVPWSSSRRAATSWSRSVSSWPWATSSAATSVPGPRSGSAAGSCAWSSSSSCRRSSCGSPSSCSACGPDMAWPQRTYREAHQDVLTCAPVVTVEPSAPQLASRVVDGAARATGGRPANDPDWWRQLAAALGCLSVVFVVRLWVTGQGLQDLGSLSGALHSFGRLTALLSSLLLLIQVVLMARVPFLERGFGHYAIVRTHRLARFTSFNLLWAHILDPPRD